MRKVVFYCFCLFFSLIVLNCAQTVPQVQKQLPDVFPKTSSAVPKADFQSDVTEGFIPLPVKFVSKCIGDISYWKWDFGDGESAFGPLSQHLYSREGIFSVTLTIEGAGGSDTHVKSGYIRVISDIINWKLAKNYIGQNKTVEGIIVGSHYATNVRGKPTFFNFNNPYTGYFTCVLWDSDRPKFVGKFSSPPESYFLQKQVRVRGLIEEYPKGSGVPEIVLTDPLQITILEK
jgi:PKD repeat protein